MSFKVKTLRNGVLTHPQQGVPVGTLCFWMGSTIPDGWIMANGATLQTTDYPELFDKFGYAYGGAGTSFTLPNLTGSKYFLRCNSVAGEVQSDAIRNIYGTIYSLQAGASGDCIFYNNGTGTPQYASGSIQWTANISMDASRVVPVANENRPINMSSIPIIKYE